MVCFLRLGSASTGRDRSPDSSERWLCACVRAVVRVQVYRYIYSGPRANEQTDGQESNNIARGQTKLLINPVHYISVVSEIN